MCITLASSIRGSVATLMGDGLGGSSRVPSHLFPSFLALTGRSLEFTPNVIIPNEKMIRQTQKQIGKFHIVIRREDLYHLFGCTPYAF